LYFVEECDAVVNIEGITALVGNSDEFLSNDTVSGNGTLPGERVYFADHLYSLNGLNCDVGNEDVTAVLPVITIVVVVVVMALVTIIIIILVIIIILGIIGWQKRQSRYWNFM
jgi:hypothetical protein